MSSCGDTIFLDDDDDKEEEVVFVRQQQNETVNVDENEKSTIEEMENSLMKAIVNSHEEAYELYCDYAHVCGFSVRKGKQYFNSVGQLSLKQFVCSKEGIKRSKRGSNTSHEKLDTRTNCKAMVQFQQNEDGKWRVNKLIKEHNHEMARSYEKHMIRSVRHVSLAQGNTLEQMVNSGINTSQAFAYMAKEGSGIGNLGFLKKDAYNDLNNRRNSIIEKGDAQSLVNHFKDRSSTEGMFFWDLELDDEGRIHNFFWRDSRCQIDYDFFGDIVVFDATYRTNRYNLVCAPFIGVNHHWQTIILGCAFLSDESTTSFEWAFRSFLASMNNKQPVTFMTDQDLAIMKAADIIFTNSQHRLYL